MSEFHSFVWGLIGAFNFAWFGAMIFLVRCMIVYPKVGTMVKEMIENGDDKGNHEDGNKAAILMGAIIMIWVYVNSVFAGFLDGVTSMWYVIWGTESLLLLGLLGLKKLSA